MAFSMLVLVFAAACIVADAQGTTANVVPSVSWGPGNCVSTYKGESGSCILKTHCTGQDITKYSFSMVCLEDSGATSRHVFGTNSFDPEETFDTLISCKECRADPNAQNANQAAVDPEAAILSIKSDVDQMKVMMTAVTDSVQKLNVKVFGTPSPLAPTNAPVVVAPVVAPVVAVVAEHIGQPQVQRTEMDNKVSRHVSRWGKQVPASSLPAIPQTFLGASHHKPKRAYDTPEAFLPPPKQAAQSSDDDDDTDSDGSDAQASDNDASDTNDTDDDDQGSSLASDVDAAGDDMEDR